MGSRLNLFASRRKCRRGQSSLYDEPLEQWQIVSGKDDQTFFYVSKGRKRTPHPRGAKPVRLKASEFRSRACFSWLVSIYLSLTSPPLHPSWINKQPNAVADHQTLASTECFLCSIILLGQQKILYPHSNPTRKPTETPVSNVHINSSAASFLSSYLLIYLPTKHRNNVHDKKKVKSKRAHRREKSIR